MPTGSLRGLGAVQDATLKGVLQVSEAPGYAVKHGRNVRQVVTSDRLAAVNNAVAGEEGLPFAKMVDVIVTGLRLPGTLDGVELVRLLRQQAATQGTPIIVLTAAALEPDRKRALDAGCDVFLRKPCLPEHLATAVRRTLNERPQRRAS